jgi:hypothetical protein
MVTKRAFTVFGTCVSFVKLKPRVLSEKGFMNERDFFNEKEEVKKAVYSCPHCRERGEYDVRWLKRTKKPQLPRGANEQDRARFQKSRDYMVRIDDMLACRNVRCRRRFEIPSFQSVVFI